MNRLANRQSTGVILAILIVLAISWPVQPKEVRAQAATPTPSPTSPNLAVIAGAGGVTLWDTDGSQVASAAPGARLTATQRSTDNGWLFVEMADGATGWVATDDVLVFNAASLPDQAVTITPVTPTATATPMPAATPASEQAAAPAEASTIRPTSAQPPAAANGQPTVQVAQQVSGLNVRAGPGTGYAVIRKATAGDTFVALGRNQAGDWVQIETPEVAGGLGWVSATYVTASQAVSSLPVVETINQSAPQQPVAAPANAAQASQAPAPTGPTGLRGKLVFQTSWGGAIYLYELETGTLRHLTGGFDPSISPDGRQVAFTRFGGQHGIYLINVDGSNERNIFSERVGFLSPKWSPDGQWIGFTRLDRIEECFDATEGFGFPQCVAGLNPFFRSFPRIEEIRPRISRIDVNGDNYRDIPTLEDTGALDWNTAGIVYASPAGIQVTQDSTADVNRSVYFDVYQQYYQDPDWQPGGGRIVFQHKRPGHWDIYSVNPDGTGFTALTRPPTALVDTMPSNVAPAWSPDGQHIVFLGNRLPNNEAGAWGIWVMNADGSNQRRLPIDLPFEYNYVEEQMIDWGP